MDDQDEEIIARGEWTQGANGDITYYPSHIRPKRLVGEAYEGWSETAPDLDAPDLDGPSPAPAHTPSEDPGDETRGDNRGGYRIRSGETWDRARRDYLAGDSAPGVCDRYDLSLGAFRSRAARENWRRSDGEDPAAFDPAPFDPGAEPAVEDADIETMAAHALIRAQRAIARGRASEAATWLRIHRQLTRLIPAVAAPAADPVPKPAPKPVPAPARRPEPDPFHLLNIRMKAVGEVARAAAALNPDNAHGHAAIGELLAHLKTMPVAPVPPVEPGAPAEPPISDDSDDSDPVFSGTSDRIDPPPEDEE